jgi:ubiquinone/menaquinone biosynthesis C-methylase UbiE
MGHGLLGAVNYHFGSMSERTGDLLDVVAYYAQGLESGRLDRGPGALELVRTQAILERILPSPPARVADIGGGPGRYALWLANRGYHVHLVDPVQAHIQEARAASRDAGVEQFMTADTGDARELALPDASVDVVLLLGPLYHLTTRAERVRALSEARRICCASGVVLAAAISRFASTLDGLRGGYLEDPAFAAVAAADRATGQHRNPTRDPTYFTTAYFHLPNELAEECVAAGLAHEVTLAVEGPGWLLPDIDARLADPLRRAALLEALAALETEATLLGVSAHLLAVARA